MKSILLALIAVAGLGGFVAQDGFERERGRPTDAAKNELEGNAPPDMAGDWFNHTGKAIDWKSLAGKVVILDFWAHW